MHRWTLSLCFLLVILPRMSLAQTDLSAEEVVRRLYDLVTFDAGENPDWDGVRGLFLEQAVIVLRTSREASTTFDLEGFVGDFIHFIETAEVTKTGFREEIQRLVPTVFGDIAHFLVLYEASITGSERPPTVGVDSFQLIRTAEGWKIASVINEIPTKDRPIPEALHKAE